VQGPDGRGKHSYITWDISYGSSDMIMGYKIYMTHLNISGYSGIIWDI
jgi:hypothetical protein